MSLIVSSSMPNDWVLLQWDNDDYDLVCERSVLSSLEILKEGDEMFFMWQGEQRKAKFITCAGRQNTVKDSMRQNHGSRDQEAGPSISMFDLHEDDSSSSSSFSDYVPQDETTEDEEEDSDMDSKKRIKLERCKATPSLRATPVLPKTTLPRKKTHISSPQNDESNPNKTMSDQLVEIYTDLQTLEKMLGPKDEGDKEIVPTKYKAENQSVVDDVTENKEVNSEHEEPSSSDNNVLIHNKLKVITVYSENDPSGPSVSNPSGPSVSNPSGPSVSNPSGSSTSKKIRKAENKDRTRYNQSVNEDVSEDEEDVASKFRETRAHEEMIKLFKDNLRTSVSNPSGPSVSNPSGSSTSKKIRKAENTDRARYNQSVEEDVLENEEDVALKLRDAHSLSVAMKKMLENNLKPSESNQSGSSVTNPSGPSTSKNHRQTSNKLKVITVYSENGSAGPSVSNPSGPSTSKKIRKAENTDRARYNQSVEEDVLENEEDVALKFRFERVREGIIQMLKDSISPSVSNPSRSSVSNQSGPSTSKTYEAENTDQSRYNQSLEEDVTEDEEETSDHEEFNRSDDNVLITNKYRNVTVKTVNKGDELVPIGTGKTQITLDKFMKVNWKSYTVATRTLLLAVFSRRVLATHSLTGKKSPAFQDKPAKNCLDPKKTSDVIAEIRKRFDVKESLIRSIITTKCADECKMFKTRLSKNNENMLPADGEEE